MSRGSASTLGAALAAQRWHQFTIRGSGDNGFDILAFTDTRGTRVCFGGLEVDFDTLAQADVWIQRARSNAYRLRIDLIGKRPVRWALEAIVSEDETREVLVAGCAPPFWQQSQHRIIYRQNSGG